MTPNPTLRGVLKPTRRPSLPVAVIILALAALGRLDALEVREVRWGFAGHVQEDRANLLAVLVANPGPTVIEGRLRLQAGGLSRTGAPWLAPVYLSPGAQRWVVFLPWVAQHEDFKLAWQPAGGSGDQDFPVPECKPGPPAAVALVEPGPTLGPAWPVPRFPDDLFPTTVSATEGLATVLLDHAPRWSPAQSRALIEWLHGGGTLHILRSTDGAWPQFGGDLGVLNTAEPLLRLGAGTVRHHPQGRSGWNARQFGLPERTDAESPPVNPGSRQLTMDLVTGLADLVRPEHAWGLIFLILTVFVLLVGPGAWLTGRFWLDWRWLNGGLVALMIMTTVALAVIGRRGYGERSVLHSLSVARAVGDGAWDVTEWGNLFVTSSDVYRVQHPGEGHAYACGFVNESVEGAILSGGEGGMQLAMPLYTGQAFTHRGRMAGPTLAITPAVPGDGYAPGAMRLTGLPESPLLAMSVSGRAAATLAFQRGDAGAWRLFVEAQPTQVIDLGSLGDDEKQTMHLPFGHRDKTTVDQFARSRFKSLVRHSVNTAVATGLPPGRTAVFILARQPKAFHVAGREVVQQDGFVVYRIDLPSTAERP